MSIPPDHDPSKDPFDGFEISEEWASSAKKREETAQERADRYAKINWANKKQEAQQRADVVGPAKQRRRARLRKLWPWLAFIVLCALVIGIATIVGSRSAVGSMSALDRPSPDAVQILQQLEAVPVAFRMPEGVG